MTLRLPRARRSALLATCLRAVFLVVNLCQCPRSHRGTNAIAITNSAKRPAIPHASATPTHPAPASSPYLRPGRHGPRKHLCSPTRVPFPLRNSRSAISPPTNDPTASTTAEGIFRIMPIPPSPLRTPHRSRKFRATDNSRPHPQRQRSPDATNFSDLDHRQRRRKRHASPSPPRTRPAHCHKNLRNASAATYHALRHRLDSDP